MKKLLSAFFSVLIVGAWAQSPSSAIVGKWKGSIAIPTGGKLDMLLKIEELNHILLTKMDVPLQSAKDIPASRTFFSNDSLVVEFAMMGGAYKGKFKKEEDGFVGAWIQNGQVLSMPLIRSEGDILKRPQEPKPPFPYVEEEVTIENKTANVKLSGTLTLPKDKNNLTVAILISGSGPQNRNSEIFGHKEFMVIADYLTRNGIAVLRYDDRGVGKSTGNFSEATSYDFSTDAEAAVEYLKTRKEINKKKIGLIGHSEGGLIAPLLTSRSKDIGFVIMLAGPGIKCTDLLMLQSAAQARSMGADDNLIEQSKKLNRKIYNLVVSNKPGAIDSVKNLMQQSGVPEKNIEQEAKRIASPWFRYFLAYDPATVLPKVNCPILAINGKKDLQVTYPENPEGIEAICKNSKKKNCTVKVFDDLNHLMQHCVLGTVSEYGSIEETFSPEVLQLMNDWMGGLK